MAFWSPEGLGRSTSAALLFIAHTACLICLSALLQSCCYPWRSSQVLAFQICWGFHYNWGKTFTNGLSWALWGLWPCHMVPCLSFYIPFNSGVSTTTTETSNPPVTSPGLSQFQTSTALHDPFSHAKSTKTKSTQKTQSTMSGCQFEIWAWLSLIHSLCVLRKQFPEDFTQWCWSFINHGLFFSPCWR